MRSTRVFLFALSVLGACAAPGGLPSADARSLHIPHGQYRTFPAPRTGMGPGQLVRVDATGRMFEVAMLADVEVQSEGYELPAHGWFGTSSVRAFLSMLDADAVLASETIDGGLGGASGNALTFEFRAADGLREFLVDAQLEAAIEGCLQGVREDLVPADDYFLVRDTISVESLAYRLDEAATAAIGGRAAIASYASAGFELEQGTRQSLELSRAFDRPMRILYRLEPVQLSDYPGLLETAEEHAERTREEHAGQIRATLQRLLASAERNFEDALLQQKEREGGGTYWSSDVRLGGRPAIVLPHGQGVAGLGWPFEGDAERTLWQRTWFTFLEFDSYKAMRAEFRMIQRTLAEAADWSTSLDQSDVGGKFKYCAAIEPERRRWQPAVLVRAGLDGDVYRVMVYVYANRIKTR